MRRLLWAIIMLSITGCVNASAQTNTAGAYEGTALNDPAASFRLTDQTGATVSLEDFRGKIIVLTFVESQCQETCPLTAAHLRDASRMLGTDASSVIFVGINVNTKANAVADVATATQKWHLDEIQSWHFLTGSEGDLEAVWKAYNIFVQLPTRAGEELLHTPGVYIIDKTARKRWYVSVPAQAAGTSQWIAPLSKLLVKHIQELLRE